MMTVRVKICGISHVEDALAAAEAGADAVGLVFHGDSPRAVDPEQAARIARPLPPFLSVVALFVDARPGQVRAVIDAVAPHYLQFHGEESADYCAQFGLPWIKAVRVGPGDDAGSLARRAAAYAGAAAILLDGARGGSGKAFDWGLAPRHLERPLVLAGGLTPGNVAQAVREVRPAAVDVSSGVEKVRGRKDAVMIAEFVSHARQALEP